MPFDIEQITQNFTEVQGDIEKLNASFCAVLAAVEMTADLPQQKRAIFDSYSKIFKAKHVARRLNLRGADLRGADLRGADLREADLQGADLQKANLQGADLQKANLRHADLQNANLLYADLQNANLLHADLQGAFLREANLLEANLLYADLQEANLREANLQEANLQEADLREANLQGSNLLGSNLQGADLQQADLRGANLQEAYMPIAILQGAHLQEANLRGAFLRGAFLRRADLQGANLQYSILIGTDLADVQNSTPKQLDTAITTPEKLLETVVAINGMEHSQITKDIARFLPHLYEVASWIGQNGASDWQNNLIAQPSPKLREAAEDLQERFPTLTLTEYKITDKQKLINESLEHEGNFEKAKSIKDILPLAPDVLEIIIGGMFSLEEKLGQDNYVEIPEYKKLETSFVSRFANKMSCDVPHKEEFTARKYLQSEEEFSIMKRLDNERAAAEKARVDGLRK